MDIFNETYHKLRQSFINVAILITAVVFFVALIVSYVILICNPQMIRLPLFSYILLYIFLPTFVNIALIVVANHLIHLPSLSEQVKNYISVLLLSSLCFIISCVHNVFSIATCTLCIPIFFYYCLWQ